jgi:hypothetical protein
VNVIAVNGRVDQVGDGPADKFEYVRNTLFRDKVDDVIR